MNDFEKLLVNKSAVVILKNQAQGLMASNDAYDRGVGAGIRITLEILVGGLESAGGGSHGGDEYCTHCTGSWFE